MADPNEPARGERHESEHPHEHGHVHDEGHGTDHEHAMERSHAHAGHDEHGHAHAGWLDQLFHLRGHDHDDLTIESLAATSERGIWALKVSLLSLFATAVVQVVIVMASGSVALLADTIHNFADASTAVPLWIAFALNRRRPPRGYTYRYGKAEDLAGLFIVSVITISAGVVFYEAAEKLLHPRSLQNLGWVAAAGLAGFLGNELAALVRMRIGREIGSAALVADGMHARIDGLTSLAVVIGALGVWLGFPLADPIVGLLIGIAILFVVRDAARAVWRRLLDAVDPELVDEVEHTAGHIEGVRGVHDVRLRWLGHVLWGELHVEVAADLPTFASHAIAEEVRHALFHALPRLQEISVHVDPCPCRTGDPGTPTTRSRLIIHPAEACPQNVIPDAVRRSLPVFNLAKESSHEEAPNCPAMSPGCRARPGRPPIWLCLSRSRVASACRRGGSHFRACARLGGRRQDHPPSGHRRQWRRAHPSSTDHRRL